MSAMDSGRDRIMKALRGEKTDSVPVSPMIYTNYVRKYFQDYDADIVDKTTELYSRLGSDIIHRNCFPALYFFVDTPGPVNDDWQVHSTISDQSDKTTWDTRIHTPKGDLALKCEACRMSPYEKAYAYGEVLVKNNKDLDLLVQYEPRWSAATLDWAPVRRAKKSVGDKGIVCPWVQGVFNFAGVFYRNFEELLMDPYTDPGFYATLMAHSLEQNWSYLKQLLEQGADALAYGGNLAGGQVGPEFYEKFVLPYEKELIRRIHGKGGYVIYHNCGKASALFELYKETGMDCFESLAQPPEGDTELHDAKKRLAGIPCLAGGIDQKTFLVHATPQEVGKVVKETLDVMNGRGGYILSTVDYLSEDTPFENVRAFVDAGRNYGTS